MSKHGYTLVLSREAERFYARCDGSVSNKLARCFEALEKDPRAGNNVKALKGKFAGSYRYRVGDLRVVYTINDRRVTVFVITIARRRTCTNDSRSCSSASMRVGITTASASSRRSWKTSSNTTASGRSSTAARSFAWYAGSKLRYPFNAHFIGQRAADSLFYYKRVEAGK